jgi:hypothetical protein
METHATKALIAFVIQNKDAVHSLAGTRDLVQSFRVLTKQLLNMYNADTLSIE